MIRRISVRGIVLSDNKLLCVRLHRYDGSIQMTGDYWCLPGGGLDEGESLIDGINREMVEETGIKPAVGNLLYVQQFAYDDKEYLEFFFHITNSEDYQHIDLSKTTHGEKEIAAIGFIDPTSVNIKPGFLATEALSDVAVSNGATKIISRL